jgi:hypothetical protein
MSNQRKCVETWKLAVMFLLWNLMIAAIILPKFQLHHEIYASLTKELRRYERRDSDELKKDIRLLEEARAALRECEAVHKAQQ